MTFLLQGEGELPGEVLNEGRLLRVRRPLQRVVRPLQRVGNLLREEHLQREVQLLLEVEELLPLEERQQPPEEPRPPHTSVTLPNLPRKLLNLPKLSPARGL